MDDFIKIPRDFKSLHDLGDLVSNFEITNRLMVALNDYQMAYINSMLLTGDQLLKTIPKRDHSKFTLKCRDKLFEHMSSVHVYTDADKGFILSPSSSTFSSNIPSTELDKLVKRHSRKMASSIVVDKTIPYGTKYTIGGVPVTEYFNTEINTLTRRVDRINKIGDNKNIKMYLPNFDTKTITVCYWVKGVSLVDPVLLVKLDAKIALAKKIYWDKRGSSSVSCCRSEETAIDNAKTFKKKNMLNIPCDSGSELVYDKFNISFKVEPADKKLIVIIPFTFTDTFTVGGNWIGTGGGGRYLSGGKSTPYTRGGKDFYIFCTRTNKFIGTYQNLEDSRGWVSA